MDRTALNRTAAAILMALADHDGPAPASAIYLGLGMDRSLYDAVTGILAAGGAILRTPDTITLTAKGRAVAAECAAALRPTPAV